MLPTSFLFCLIMCYYQERRVIKVFGFKTLSTVTKQSLTNANGEYDPARVIGYFTASLGVLTYLFLSGYVIITTGKMDFISWGLGFTGVSGSCLAAAWGVNIKLSSEGPIVPPAPPPPPDAATDPTK